MLGTVLELLPPFMLLAGGLLGLYGWSHLQTEQAAAQRATDAKTKARVALAHAAAHELRQPLQTIVSLVGALRTRDPQYLGSASVSDRLEQSAKSLNRTLLNAIDAFDLWSGQCKIGLQAVDLHTEVTLAVRRKNKELAEQGSAIKVLCGHLPDLWCELDPARLQQVLDALIDEAAFHTTDERVRVNCLVEHEDRHQHRLTVSVHASGLSLSDTDAKTLFSPSQYNDNRLLKGRPAAMMALNVAHQVTSLMDGTIRVESQPGSGTRFVLELPVVACPPARTFDLNVELPKAFTDRGLNPDFGEFSVLLVDDNEMNLFVLQELVQPLGFGRVICANSGQEAIERCGREPIDLVLMDLVMPGTDGFIAAEKIQTRHGENAPIIVAVSAKPDADSDPRYAMAGFQRALQKPVSNVDFLATLLDLAPSLVARAEARKRAGRGPIPLRLASG